VSISMLADLVAALGATRVLETLLEASLKGSVLLLLAWVVVRSLRHASAASRHLVWATALGGMLLMPALTAVMPRLSVTGLPSIRRELLPPVPVPIAAPNVETAVADLPTLPPLAPIASPRFARDVAPPSALEWQTLTRFAPLAWVVVAALVLLRIIASRMRLSSWSRRARPVDDGSWLSLAQRLAGRLNITRPVTLLRSERACVPMTWGVVYPTVLLPIDADEWTNERRTIVLMHELAHVKRLDAFTQLIAQLAVGLFWFNPLVWLAARQMRTEREHACDDCVLEGGARATDYAYDLLQIARSLGDSSGPAAAALAMARRSEFEGRLLAILDPKTKRHSVSRARLALSTASVLVLALPLAALTSAPRTTTIAEVAVAFDSPALPLPERPPLPPVATQRELPPAPRLTSPELPAEIAVLAPSSMPVALSGLSDKAQQLMAQIATLSSHQQRSSRATTPPPDRETLIAVVKQAAKMTSDNDKAELLITVAKYYIRDDELRTAYLEAVGTLTSSYEQSRTLLPLMLRDDLPAHAISQVVKIASQMSSDNDKATLLVKTITDHAAMTSSIRDAMIAAAGTISSSYDRGRTISAILKRGGLTNGHLIDLLEIIKPMGSSNDKADALIELSNRYSIDDKPVRDAYMRVAETISSSYDYRRVMTAVLK